MEEKEFMKKEGIGKSKVYKYIFVFVVLLIIITISIMLSKKYYVEKKIDAERKAIDCTNRSEEDAAIMIRAIESDNREICKELNDSGTEDNCNSYFKSYYTEVLIPEFCEIPRDKEMELRCQRLNGILSNDVEMCLPSRKNDNYDELCFFTIAYKSKDINMCNNIEFDTSKKMCQSLVSNDVQYCDEIEQQDIVEFCYSLTLNDPSFCGKVTAGQQKECYDFLKLLNAWIERPVFLECT
jgi:hypothetical protein